MPIRVAWPASSEYRVGAAAPVVAADGRVNRPKLESENNDRVSAGARACLLATNARDYSPARRRFTRSVGDIRPRECHRLRPLCASLSVLHCDLPTAIRNQSLFSEGLQSFRNAGPLDSQRAALVRGDGAGTTWPKRYAAATDAAGLRATMSAT
jgi:hypothetical protein